MRRFASLILLLLAGPLLAQGPFQPLVDRFDKFVTEGDCAGAVLVVGKKDGVKFQKALGKLDATQDALLAVQADLLMATQEVPHATVSAFSAP